MVAVLEKMLTRMTLFSLRAKRRKALYFVPARGQSMDVENQKYAELDRRGHSADLPGDRDRWLGNFRSLHFLMIKNIGTKNKNKT
jgi:hypothetical protein